MANSAVKENTVVTQEGTELTVKPLTIRNLRKFMEVIEKMNDLQREAAKRYNEYEKELKEYNRAVENDEEVGEAPEPPEEDEFAAIDIMLEAAKIALSKHNPDFVEDEDNLEDELDMPVLSEILEISGGIKIGDPNDPNQLSSPTRTARA